MRKWWDDFKGLFKPQPFSIDMARVNLEESRLRREQMLLDMDPQSAACIARVKRRMAEGVKCRIPPLYNELPPAFIHPYKVRRRHNIVQIGGGTYGRKQGETEAGAAVAGQEPSAAGADRPADELRRA